MNDEKITIDHLGIGVAETWSGIPDRRTLP